MFSCAKWISRFRHVCYHEDKSTSEEIKKLKKKKTWTEPGLFKNCHATETKQYKDKKKYVKGNRKQPQGASLFKLSFSPQTKHGTLAGKKYDFFRFTLFNVALFFSILFSMSV